MLESNKRIVMCGCHIAGKGVIEQLLKSGFNIAYFVTLDPEQAIRYKVSGYMDYREMADLYDIPVYIPEEYSLKSNKDISFFKEQRFDLLIQGGWQRLFPEQVIKSLSIGAIGVHGSSDFLPKGRGRSPLNWSLIEGKRRFIMHLFLMREGIDDGDVIDTEVFDINEFDDIRTLYYKNTIVVKRMMLRALPKLLKGEIDKWSQVGIPSYYPKRNEEDGEIIWEEMDIYDIYNLVRAVTKPYPGAFANIDGKTFRIWKCQIFDTRICYRNARYGEIVERFGNDLIINCRGGLLLVTDYEIIK
jgi:methionyl-tRNA formyltransferase